MPLIKYPFDNLKRKQKGDVEDGKSSASDDDDSEAGSLSKRQLSFNSTTRQNIETSIPQLDPSSFEILNSNLKKIKEEKTLQISNTFKNSDSSYIHVPQPQPQPQIQQVAYSQHVPSVSDIGASYDRSFAHNIISNQKSRFNKVLLDLITDVTLSMNRSDLAANLCLFSYLVNRTLDYEMLSRATPFSGLTVSHEWFKQMPPMEEMLHLVNQFIQQKPSLERANFEWLWKTNSKLMARLISSSALGNQSITGTSVDEVASRRLTGLCHCFSSYFSNLKMCLHIHGLMAAEEGDIFLKPQTLELAESLIEACLRWIFFYKGLNKQQTQHTLQPAQSKYS